MEHEVWQFQRPRNFAAPRAPGRHAAFWRPAPRRPTGTPADGGTKNEPRAAQRPNVPARARTCPKRGEREPQARAAAGRASTRLHTDALIRPSASLSRGLPLHPCVFTNARVLV